jgi:hypothetical protein
MTGNLEPPQMKPLLDTILFLAWVSVYLTAVFWVGRYRRARAQALGLTWRSDYRADKDIGLWLMVFVLGLLLFFAAYLVTSVIGQFS